MVRALNQAWLDLGKGNDIVLVHGNCPTGADRMASEIWGQLWGFPVEAHPALWKTEGKASGPRRNQRMVDLGADGCLAFIDGPSRGTRDCADRARKAGIPVRYFQPSSDERTV